MKATFTIPGQPQGSKYHNIKTVIDGITFDSKREAQRYCELLLMTKAKLITDLEMQKRYEIVPKSKHGKALYYVADFVYIENGQTVVEDVKSKATITPLYKLKRRLMAERYGIKIVEV